MRPRNGAVVFIGLATVLAAGSASTAAPDLTDPARDLIEGVLGVGTVKAIRSTGAGSGLLVRWESPTFAKASNMEDARQTMHAEVVLVAGAVFQYLRSIQRIRFTIVRGSRMLATGEQIRGRTVHMVFSAELGGPYAPAAPAPAPRPSGGTAQEL